MKRLLIALVLTAATACQALAGQDVLYLKQYDLQPYYYAQIVDSSEAAVDLTGASVVFTMQSKDGSSVPVNRQAATITDAANGFIEYHWQAGDTDTVGAYYVEFEVTPAAGGKYTVPSSPRDRAPVNITASLDDQ